MECVKNPEKNCCSGGFCTDEVCPKTHSCCSQKTVTGENSTLGICVKKDEKGGKSNCDTTKGLPIKTCRDSTNKYKMQNSFENFQTVTKEGYNDDNCDCDDWQNAFNILFLIIIILVVACSVFYLRCKNR
jgi:hypothetical protein